MLESHADVIIVGAGAAGLMAARELSKAGRKIVILEARNRTGGRIYPLSEDDFGYPAQGGAEFVHGEAKTTHELIKEAGLHYVATGSGENWNLRKDEAVKLGSSPLEDPNFVVYREKVMQKLAELKGDIPISTFLQKNFEGEEYSAFRECMLDMVEGYDAGDPSRISTFSLRDEWLNDKEWKQGRIREGYTALLAFLESGCIKKDVKILLKRKVTKVEIKGDTAIVTCSDGKNYESEKVIITVPLPLVSSIRFIPPIPQKIEAVSKIGFGQVVKVLIKFKERWWLRSRSKDLSNMLFADSVGVLRSCYTQYPENYPVLTGWIVGKNAEKIKNESDEFIIDLVLNSLSNQFGTEKSFIQGQVVISKVINWPKDQFSLGAYSYATLEKEEALKELSVPSSGRIYFAGEALCGDDETASVEAALQSGKETTDKILGLSE